MNSKEFKKVILFMANQWSKDVAVEIFGNSLGVHFYSKWVAEANNGNPDNGTMCLFYEMTTDNLQLLLDYITKNYKG